jgi:protein gp37
VATTKIEWAESVWNPVTGCTVLSPGCSKCYAMRMASRLEAMGKPQYQGTTKKVNRLPVWAGKINLIESALTIPLKRQKPTVWFVNSMSDLFHEAVAFEYVDRVFAVMALCPQHTFQVLTKRSERMAEYVADRSTPGSGAYVGGASRTLVGGYEQVLRHVYRMEPATQETLTPHDFIKRWPLPNVWLGTSVEDQKRADERIPHLLRCPASVRFLSCEPLLGPIDIRPWLSDLDWVIEGGESGFGARRYDVSWGRFLQTQCRQAEVAYFRKQMGAYVYDDHTTSACSFPPEMCWPEGTKTDYHRIMLKDSKGGKMEEWPPDMRCRQFPTPAGKAEA